MRFTLLFHRVPPGSPRTDHYDLMLEASGVLLTWELTDQPFQADGVTHARRLPDHRLFYLDFEGLLTENRGQVERVSTGELSWQTPPAPGALTLQAVATATDTHWLVTLARSGQSDDAWLVEWRKLG